MKTKNLIIGAGPSGLTLAQKFQQKGEPFLLVDAARSVGGLCASLVTDDGAVFDMGGHSFHTPHAEVQSFVEEILAPVGGMFWQKRDARVFFDGQMIPYPFQQHVNLLKNDAVRSECQEPPQIVRDDPANFDEYLRSRFSYGVAKHFMLPYNQKLWKMPLNEISTSWTSQRIAKPKEESFEAAGERIALQPSTMVGYPKYYPFQAIFEGMFRNLKTGTVLLNTQLVGIDEEKRMAAVFRFGQHDTIEYDRLFLTIPMNQFMGMLHRIDRKLEYASCRLKYLSLVVTNISLTTYQKDTPQRLYCGGDDVCAHKIAFNNKSSDYWEEANKVAVMAETSIHSDLFDAKSSNIEYWSVMNFLRANGFIDFADVESYFDVRIRYAYPIQTIERDSIVSAIQAAIEPFGIYSLGRFGSWRYVNSDACIHEAMELADSL